jgi:tol-pal system protein YbgF
MLLQIQGLDSQLRQLTGKLEEFEYSIGALASRLDRLVGDVDLRLQTLESSMQMVLAQPPAAAPQASQPRVFTLPPTQPVQQVPLQQSQIQAGIDQSVGTGATGSSSPSTGAVQLGSVQGTTIISSSGATATTTGQQAAPVGQTGSLLPGQMSLGTVSGSQLAATQTGAGTQAQGNASQASVPVQGWTGPVPKAGQVRPLSLNQAAPPPTPRVNQQASTPSILPPGTPKQRYDYAFSLLQKRDFETAERALRAFLQQHPEDAHAGNAYYWLGETYYVRKYHEDAAKIFADGYERFPEGSKAPDNLLKLGMSLTAIDRVELACKTFSELLRKFPNANTRILENAKGEFGRAGCK